jgi:hypothetical protein
MKVQQSKRLEAFETTNIAEMLLVYAWKSYKCAIKIELFPKLKKV